MKKKVQIERMVSVVTLIIAILCSSCANMQKKKSESYLRTEMQALRSDLPSTIDEVTTLIEVSMEGNNFVYTYYVNDYADGVVLLQAWDINDTKNGNQFSLSFVDNQYDKGSKYQFTISEPNLDYNDPGYNIPVFEEASQLVLTVNEII